MTTDVIHTDLAAEPASVGLARRRIVEDALTRWKEADLVDTALLVVSELATNAVPLTSAPTVLRLYHHPEVSESKWPTPAQAAPVAKNYAADATTGRGLEIVAVLASG